MDDTPDVPDRPSFISPMEWIVMIKAFSKDPEQTMKIATKKFGERARAKIEAGLKKIQISTDGPSIMKKIDDWVKKTKEKAEATQYERYKKMRKDFEDAPEGSTKKKIADARDKLSKVYVMSGKGTDEDLDRAINAAITAGVTIAAKKLYTYITKKYPNLLITKEKIGRAVERTVRAIRHPRMTFDEWRRARTEAVRARSYPEGLPEGGEVEMTDVGSFPPSEEDLEELNRAWEVETDLDEEDVFEDPEEIPEEMEAPDVEEIGDRFGVPKEYDPSQDPELQDDLIDERDFDSGEPVTFEDDEPPPLEPINELEPVEVDAPAELEEIVVDDIMAGEGGVAGEGAAVEGVTTETIGGEAMGAVAGEGLTAALGPAAAAAAVVAGPAYVGLEAIRHHQQRENLLSFLENKRESYETEFSNRVKNLGFELQRKEDVPTARTMQAYYGPSALSYMKFREEHPEITYPPVNDVLEKIGKAWRGFLGVGDFQYKPGLDYSVANPNSELDRGIRAVYGGHKTPWGFYNRDGREIEDYVNNYQILSKWRHSVNDENYKKAIQEIMDEHRVEMSYSSTPKEGVFGVHPIEDSFAKATKEQERTNRLHATKRQIQDAIDRGLKRQKMMQKYYASKSTGEMELPPHTDVFLDTEHPYITADVPLNMTPHALDGKRAKNIHGSGVTEVDKNFHGFGYQDPKTKSLTIGQHGVVNEMSHDKNKEKTKSSDHAGSHTLQMIPPNGPDTGLKQPNREIHHTTPSGYAGPIMTYHPHDADHPLGGYPHHEHYNSVGVDHQPHQMVEPGRTYDPMEAASQANVAGGPRSGMTVGDLRAIESFMHSTMSHEPLATVAHQNYMHYLGEHALFV